MLRRTALQSVAISQVSQAAELLSGQIELLARKITQLAAETTGCERVNVWLFNEAETVLHCIDLYEATPARHSSGMVLEERHYRNEFEAFKVGRHVAADNPLNDPRTAGYVESYLKPLGITSMLDTVIQMSGKNLGLLCFEHVGKEHHWEADEISFAHQLADKLGIALVSCMRRQAEEAVRASEARFRTIYNSVSDGIFAHELETGRILDVNQRVLEMYGYSREEILAGDVGMLSAGTPPYTQAEALVKVAAARAGDTPPFEWHMRRKDGSTFWGEVSLRRASFGTQEIILATVRDISERKRDEEALRTSRQILEGILNAIPVRVFWKDKDLVYLGCNRAFAEDAGFKTPEDIVGKDDFQLGWRTQADLYRKHDRQVIDTGQAKFLIEEPQTTPDGRTLTLLTSKLPLRGPDGGIDGVLGSYMDITARKRAEEAVRRSEAELAEAQRLAGLGSWTWDPREDLVTWSEELYRIVGRDPALPAPGIGEQARLFTRDSYDAMIDALKNSLKTGTSYAIDLEFLKPDGSTGWILARGEVERDSDGNLVRARGTALDITERKLAQEQVSQMARSDMLTGLANRGAFVEALQQAIARTRRGGAQFAVLYLDLDHFKDINDMLGHPIGDLLLKAVAQRLKASVRETDTVARFGGDEFAIIQSDVDDPEDAALLAEKLLKSVGEPFSIDDNEIRIGTSIGIAVFSPEPSEAETLLSRADVALYRAKSEGRGTYRFFTESMDAEVRARVRVGFELRQAIQSDQLFLLYQPQVDAGSGRIIGMEALVRWRHPTRGVVMPAEFIAIAERSGLIVALGRWVAREACRQAKAWLDEGLDVPLVAVNLSALQFKTPHELEKDIADILSETGLPSQKLELELTETALMEASQEHNDALLNLRRAGLRIAIDDFGTGYSSLDYLRRFPVDRIKIAESFISGLTETSSNAAIVKAALGLARELNLSVVIEGVETERQLALVKSWGGTQVQGRYFAPALLAAELEPLLADGHITPKAEAARAIPGFAV